MNSIGVNRLIEACTVIHHKEPMDSCIVLTGRRTDEQADREDTEIQIDRDLYIVAKVDFLFVLF